MSELNKNIEIFFIDLDGTTLDIKKDNKRWISDENLSAIKEVQAQGKHVVISTGRMAGLEEFMEATNTQYIIGGNGAMIKNNKGKFLKEIKMSTRQTLLLLDIVKKHNLVIIPDATGIAYGVKTKLQRYIAKKLHSIANSGYTFELHKQYYKFGLVGKTKAKLEKIMDEINTIVPDVAVVTSSGGWSIEVTHKDATKGAANEYVANKYFNITDKSKMAHIGDTMNDSTAVDHMGQFIVMKNAEKQLKDMSPYRGPHYKRAGLAKILRGNYKKVK